MRSNRIFRRGGAIFWVMGLFSFGAFAEFASPESPLAERFANPPAGARILPIKHVFPLDPVEQDATLQQLAESGFGGMVTNISFDEYLRNESHWAALRRGVEAAKARGFTVWVYDEKGYPSGNAGGLTMESHPEWEASGILAARTEINNGGEFTLDSPPGALLQAAAFPVVDEALDTTKAIDLTDRVKEGKLTWAPPEGRWQIMIFTESRLYEGTHAAVSLADKLPYVNLMMPEPTARFLELTHGGYAAHLGEDLGRWFEATFTDEPSLMSLYMREQPWAPLPWAPGFAEAFEKRCGYSALSILPKLLWGKGPDTEKARSDFWGTVGDLVSENYFGQIQEWCRRRHIPSGGHLLLEEAILSHVPLYGDFFQCLRRLDAPSMDCLTSIPSEVPWYVGRLISSAAALEGRTLTMSESSDHSQCYRPAGDSRPSYTVSEDEIRGSFNRLLVSGITTFTSYYTFKDISQEQLIRLNTWVGRCSTMVKGGHQVTDLAVVYPAESMMAHYAASRRWTADAPMEARDIEDTYRETSQLLFGMGRDFTYIDGKAIAEAAVEKGVLRINELAWRAVLLPAIDTLPEKAWENLAAFWRSGGVVIALGAFPKNSTREFPSPAAAALARELFGEEGTAILQANEAGGAALYLGPGQQGMLGRVIEDLIAPDVRLPKESPLRNTHRRIDGKEVYFIINDSAAPWTGTLGFSAEGAGEQWDPLTGACTPGIDPNAVSLQLPPYGGMLFRFAAPKLPEKRTPVKGPIAGLTPEALPPAAPTIVAGEFVETALGAAADGGPWTLRAKLKKGDVDTFEFLNFPWDGGMDLSIHQYLAVDLEIPEGQACDTAILLILQDIHGVEYFASTGIRLNRPGAFHVCLPLAQFARAGWSKQPDQPLDFQKIQAIRIGWGGYLGEEGEEIAFTTHALRGAGGK